MEFTNAMVKYGQMNQNLIKYLDQFENLGGIFDAAKDQRVAVMAREHPSDSKCLYGGETAKRMQFTSPYVFDFSKNKTLRDLMATLSWGESWGIWYDSVHSIEERRAAFRRHHMTELPDQRKVYLRFFDPRIFPTFFEHCEAEERHDFAKGVRQFLLESEHAKNRVLTYKLNQGKFVKSEADF